MKLTLAGLRDRAAFEKAGIALPTFDIDAMRAATEKAPTWMHFGTGNIFRAFPCAAQAQLLDMGLVDTGIIACETYDAAIIEDLLAAHDNLSLLVTLRADGNTGLSVVASIADAIAGDEAGIARMEALFEAPTLQMVSFTVTEKAYNASNPVMAQLCRMLLSRFKACAKPLAMVSMDNCAHNGDKLRDALLPTVRDMVAKGEAEEAFLAYMQNDIAFPITMIDKITPHPGPDIAKMLADKGIEDMDIIRTEKGTVTAPFVNAEEAQYLVIEDAFPNGRPPLEKAGIIFTDRQTVDKVEKMKVGTCLNPLHTALAVLGSLLGFAKISDEMEDDDLRGFVERLGYVESLPVVEDPGVISPRAFLDEVLKKRVNNPFLPDTPQRIATDTSQKIPVRFSWTVQATEDVSTLRCVPFVMAAWLRYLTGIDDTGAAFEPSSDPRLAEVRARMVAGLSDELLSDATLFGANLVENGMADTVRAMFSEMMEGEGAVRRALQKVNSHVAM